MKSARSTTDSSLDDDRDRVDVDPFRAIPIPSTPKRDSAFVQLIHP